MKDSKKITLTIGSIVKKMERRALNFDHPLQRASEQWSKVMIGNLISDILQENPIPDLVFAEQVVHEAPITWGIDGKQRCTNIQKFLDNKLRISDKVDRFMIEYPVPLIDEDGLPLKDDDGIVIHEKQVCDIRKKRFKDLPKELQEKFLDYGFTVVLYLDCSEENIAYHIKRYNEGRSMNVAQKGITRLGVHFANMVRNISSMSFFEDAIGSYSTSQFKNGSINRVIVESVMTTRFIDHWTKEYADMCEFIKENASDLDFNSLRNLIDRLEENVDETVGKMFTAKDSLIWFGLYSRFVQLNLEDDKFNEFMLQLNKGLHTYDENGKIIKDAHMTGICTTEINGVTYEELLKNNSTKDTNVVKSRINFLTELMCNYFGVDVPKCENSDNEMCAENTESVEVKVYVEDFIKTEIPFNTEDTALKCLMGFTSYPIRDFTEIGIKNFLDWVGENGVSKNEADDCILSVYNLRDYLALAGTEYKYSANDIAILSHYVYTEGENLDEDIYVKWLAEYNNDNHCEDKGDNQSLLEKETYMISNYINFINKECK